MAGPPLLDFDFAAFIGRDAFEGKVDPTDWFGVARAQEFRVTLSADRRLTLAPAEGAVAFGVLWMVPAEALPWLDDHFGVAQRRSQRTPARVASPAGPWTEAMIYLPAATADRHDRVPDLAAHCRSALAPPARGLPGGTGCSRLKRPG